MNRLLAFILATAVLVLASCGTQAEPARQIQLTKRLAQPVQPKDFDEIQTRCGVSKAFTEAANATAFKLLRETRA